MAFSPQTQNFSVGELKFRQIVDKLLAEKNMEGLDIECLNASKARSLRRSFYTWKENLAEMEKNFISSFEFQVRGRFIKIVPVANWKPLTPGESSDVPDSQGESA